MVVVLNVVFASLEVGGVRRKNVVGLDRIKAAAPRLIAGRCGGFYPVSMVTKPAMVRPAAMVKLAYAP